MKEVSFNNPFFAEITKYPGRFAHPVFFGPPADPVGFTPLANGTGTVLKFDNRFLGVTCHHVLEGYRRQKLTDERIVFQFGSARFEPESILIQENDFRSYFRGQ